MEGKEGSEVLVDSVLEVLLLKNDGLFLDITCHKNTISESGERRGGKNLRCGSSVLHSGDSKIAEMASSTQAIYAS